MKSYQSSRRNFMKMAGLLSAGLTTNTSSFFHLQNLGKLVSTNSWIGPQDYKAMVCIFLNGGADSFNMLVPYGSAEYQVYAQSRSNLALSHDSLLPISPLNLGGTQYGLHPAMSGMHNLFNQGKACFISNVGTLIDHVTKPQFENGTGALPVGLFSHSDQGIQWQTGEYVDRVQRGWAGRMADLMYDANDNQTISMNVSLSGNNIFQRGNNVEFSVSSYGAISLDGYDPINDWGYNFNRTKAIDSLLTADDGNIFRQSYRNIFSQSKDANAQFDEAISNVPEFNTIFNDEYPSNQLSMIAKIIAARETLGFKRQIFFVDVGSWDHHDELLNSEMYNLLNLDRAITSFHQALDEIGVADDVVTFTLSEFGRTLTSNGNGTDHAWGGNTMVFGNAVQGNRIFGQYPNLELNNSLDLGGGVLIPTTPTDLYFAELALWFGLSASQLYDVFPNLNNFYASGTGQAPLGFLNI